MPQNQGIVEYEELIRAAISLFNAVSNHDPRLRSACQNYCDMLQNQQSTLQLTFGAVSQLTRYSKALANGICGIIMIANSRYRALCQVDRQEPEEFTVPDAETIPAPLSIDSIQINKAAAVRFNQAGLDALTTMAREVNEFNSDMANSFSGFSSAWNASSQIQDYDKELFGELYEKLNNVMKHLPTATEKAFNTLNARYNEISALIGGGAGGAGGGHPQPTAGLGHQTVPTGRTR